MCLKLQIAIQLGFERAFGWWADLMVKRTLIVFSISLVFFIGLALGMGSASEYEDENVIWTPEGNPTLKAQERADKLFPQEEKFRTINLIYEAKGDNVITVDVLKEMASFETQVLYKVKEYDDTSKDSTNKFQRPQEGTRFGFTDICQQTKYELDDGTVRTRCVNGPSLLDFFYDKVEDSYDIYDGLTDEAALAQIQTGHGISIYQGEDYIYLTSFLGNTNPEPIVQGDRTNEIELGVNNVRGAKAVSAVYVIENARIDPNDDKEDAFAGWESLITEEFDVWKQNLVHTTVTMFTIEGFIESLVADINSDFNLIIIAILMVCIYTVLFLGTFSPIFCRCIVAITGLICVFLAYFSGFGFMYLIGMQTTGVHQLMPFLLIGIGVDDMFVMCNSLDQTDLKKTTLERIHDSVSHSGPAITITSLTNALAFAFGATGSLEALKSFCLFASICIVMLYLTVLTVFLAVVIWDTRRTEAKKGECCGLCMCAEDTIICCGGAFTSPKQREFTGQPTSEESLKKLEEQIAKADPAIKTVLKASATERCLGKYFAPYVISAWGRIICLAAYVIWTGVAIYGATQVEINFDIEFFVSESSSIYGWYKANEKYFDAGGVPVNTYIESDTQDFSSRENQEKLIAFNNAQQACTGCSKPWIQEESLRSWYRDLQKAVAQGECPYIAAYAADVSSFDTVVEPEYFYACLDLYLLTAEGEPQADDIVRKDAAGNFDATGTIRGWRQYIQPKRIEAVASDGPDLIDDMRRIASDYGLEDTYVESSDLLDYEQYVVFLEETLLSIGLSIMAVFLVVLFITGSVSVTCLVVMAVALVDLYLIGLIEFWGLTLNNIIVVNLVIGLGLSVDYSAHISHTYLTVDAPKELSNAEKRIYKARVALSQMGSSVLHGGISTFLAISVLGGAKSYIFVVFFKLWFGIIVFGMSNGFILLPIILSYVGPVPDMEEKKQVQERRASRRLSLKPNQLAELAKKAGPAPDTSQKSAQPTDVSKTVIADTSQVVIPTEQHLKQVTTENDIEMEGNMNRANASQAKPLAKKANAIV